MLGHNIRPNQLAATLFGLLVLSGVSRAFAAPKEQPFPAFGAVEQAVGQHFAAMPNYEPGNIIVRREVQPLLARLKQLGWTVSDADDILGQVPTSGEFLVRQLRTAYGRRFMQKIGRNPDTYDRLERLSRMPHGKLTVRELVRQPGKGSDVINYLATDKKGIQASRQMSRKVTGRGFDKPTGRIYTEEMLLERLKTSHQKDQKASANKQDTKRSSAVSP